VHNLASLADLARALRAPGAAATMRTALQITG
jgi:hypothetical protein